MKKKYILLLVTIYSFCAEAQITISGAATYTAANGSYVANSSYYLSPFYNLGTKDAGTVSYSFANSNTNSILWIVRKSNYWQIEQHYNGGPILILYVGSVTSNDLIPPCNATW